MNNWSKSVPDSRINPSPNELLQSIQTARDPWVILQQTAGIAMDRENIGGNMSSQQSNCVSRGGNPTNNKWALDGVDIMDMAATGASPAYFDFDAFEEMTITTGGFPRVRFPTAIDVFNVATSNTGQAIRSRMNASNANQIQAILAPRVLRVAVRVNW